MWSLKPYNHCDLSSESVGRMVQVEQLTDGSFLPMSKNAQSVCEKLRIYENNVLPGNGRFISNEYGHIIGEIRGVANTPVGFVSSTGVVSGVGKGTWMKLLNIYEVLLGDKKNLHIFPCYYKITLSFVPNKVLWKLY